MPESRDVTNPLDEAAISRLRKGQIALNEAIVLCQKAADCGFDCRAEQAYCDALTARYERVFHHFGGERRRA